MTKPRNELKDLKQFGSVLAGILLIFGTINFLKGRTNVCFWLFGFAVITIFLVLAAPKHIKPIYVIFSKIGHMIGWVNTRIILTLIYFGFITPIALMMKIFGRDSFNRKINKSEMSYWVKHVTAKATKEKLEKQY